MNENELIKNQWRVASRGQWLKPGCFITFIIPIIASLTRIPTWTRSKCSKRTCCGRWRWRWIASIRFIIADEKARFASWAPSVIIAAALYSWGRWRWRRRRWWWWPSRRWRWSAWGWRWWPSRWRRTWPVTAMGIYHLPSNKKKGQDQIAIKRYHFYDTRSKEDLVVTRGHTNQYSPLQSHECVFIQSKWSFNSISKWF